KKARKTYGLASTRWTVAGSGAMAGRSYRRSVVDSIGSPAVTPPSDRPTRRRALLDALAALALLTLPLLLFRQALGLWWMEDDFFQLRYALDHGPLAYGLDPEVWRRLP